MASMGAISMHSISAVRPPKYPSDGLHHDLRSLYTLIPQVITAEESSTVLSCPIWSNKGKIKRNDYVLQLLFSPRIADGTFGTRRKNIPVAQREPIQLLAAQVYSGATCHNLGTRIPAPHSGNIYPVFSLNSQILASFFPSLQPLAL